MKAISLPTTVSYSRGCVDPSLIPGLTQDQQERLTQVLDQFLRQLEAGEHPNPDELAGRHPDLAEHLRKYIGSLRSLQKAAGGIGMPIDFAIPSDGERLGDFRLIREIGRGGMAVVYEASQISIGRLVALKVLPQAAMLDTKQIARFRNEAQALGQIEHPHIVPIYSVGQDRGTHFFAMRLIEGIAFDRIIETLSGKCFAPEADSSAAQVLSQLATRRPVWFQQVATLFVPIARALHAAHELGVVHRDIKPSNLLLDRGGKPWVADFGLARWQSDSPLTKTGDLIGTVRYMSPEQARGDSALIDQRTDIYSLGITLYELATLHRAFDQNDGPKLLAHIREEGPPLPSTFAPDIPLDLEYVFLTATAPSRDARYATAREFADDLERFLCGEQTVARAPTLSERFGKFIRRHRQAALSTAGGLVLLTLSSLIAAGLIYHEKVKTDDALAASDSNFRKAREVLDRFGAQLAEELAAIPGAENVRRSLLLGTIDYYRDFIQQSNGSDDLQNELAKVLTKIALLTEHVATNEEALAAHEEARAAFDQLAKNEPDRVEHLANLALCENNLGLLLGRMGRHDEADQRFRQAIERQSAAVSRSGNEARYCRDLALTWNNLGLLLREQGRNDEASLAYQTAIHLHKDLAKNKAWSESEEGLLALRFLAATHANVAALEEDGNLDSARQSYRNAVAIQRSLVKRFAEYPELKADLALTFNNRGAMQSHLGDHAAAVESYAEAIELLDRLVKGTPSSIPYQRDLALSLNNRGLALARNGQSFEAVIAFREAAKVQQELVNRQPDNFNDVSSLGGIWNNLGLMLEGQKEPDQALAAYETALEIQRQVPAELRLSSRWQNYMDRTLVNASRLCRQQGQLEEALKLVQQRRDLWPDQPERQWSVAVEFAEIAKQEMGLHPGSSETRREALQFAAETINEGVRHCLNRSDAVKSAIFQELIGDDQFRVMLNWSDWQNLTSH